MTRIAILFTALFLALPQARAAEEAKKETPRLVLFVGVDISGSFLKGPYFENAMDFLAHYI